MVNFEKGKIEMATGQGKKCIKKNKKFLSK